MKTARGYRRIAATIAGLVAAIAIGVPAGALADAVTGTSHSGQVSVPAPQATSSGLPWG